MCSYRSLVCVTQRVCGRKEEIFATRVFLSNSSCPKLNPKLNIFQHNMKTILRKKSSASAHEFRCRENNTGFQKYDICAYGTGHFLPNLVCFLTKATPTGFPAFLRFLRIYKYGKNSKYSEDKVT